MTRALRDAGPPDAALRVPPEPAPCSSSRPRTSPTRSSTRSARASTHAGLRTHVSRGERRTIVGCIGDEAAIAELALAAQPGVESVTPVLKPYKLASRELSLAPTHVTIGGAFATGTPASSAAARW